MEKGGGADGENAFAYSRHGAPRPGQRWMANVDVSVKGSERGNYLIVIVVRLRKVRRVHCFVFDNRSSG